MLYKVYWLRPPSTAASSRSTLHVYSFYLCSIVTNLPHATLTRFITIGLHVFSNMEHCYILQRTRYSLPTANRCNRAPPEDRRSSSVRSLALCIQALCNEGSVFCFNDRPAVKSLTLLTLEDSSLGGLCCTRDSSKRTI